MSDEERLSSKHSSEFFSFYIKSNARETWCVILVSVS